MRTLTSSTMGLRQSEAKQTTSSNSTTLTHSHPQADNLERSRTQSESSNVEFEDGAALHHTYSSACTLNGLAQSHHFTRVEMVELIMDACGATAHLHSEDIVHGDIKSLK